MYEYLCEHGMYVSDVSNIDRLAGKFPAVDALAMTNRLNALAEEGWQFVTAVTTPKYSDMGPALLWYFRREKR